LIIAKVKNQFLFFLVIFVEMKIVQQVKQKAGLQMLKKISEPVRIKQAFNFDNAVSIGILYQDDDERLYNKIRAFAKELKEKHNVKNIRALGYVPVKEKMLPIWQSQKLEFGYFTQDDLNWHRRPVTRVTAFRNEDFDILIDLSDGNVLPILYLFKESKAKMKVSVQSSGAEKYADFMLIMKPPFNFEQYLQQLKLYLGNTALR
jgi:hypothetical protein